MTALAPVIPLREKSPEAFRTISEVAVELDVPQHVLRFWETKFSQIKPVKRAGGRRYYRPEDVDLLRGIRALLYHDGYTIKGVQKVLRERGLRHVAGLGRNGISLVEDIVPDAVDEEPRYARAALARLELAHAAAPPSPEFLDERRRVKLEILLAELLVMKERVAAAKPRAAV
ncbi:MAG TPA: MerR family transcriptional regulator [Rhizomicrobium sp.]|jgi:DNA-binding transcriptional MerR regulator|nr:MerR family transcriptional regulator [Rhizomicrobium sp.]